MRFKPDTTDVDLANVTMAMNPSCKITVEEAVRLKEKGVAIEIVVVSIGAARSKSILLRLLVRPAMTGMSQRTFASEVVVEGDKVNVAREVDGGLMNTSLKLPAVVTTNLPLNEPHYASMPNIMRP